MSLKFKTSSFSVYLEPPIFKEEVLAFLESVTQGQVNLNHNCVIKRVAREVGTYYREPCPITLSILNDTFILEDKDIIILKDLLNK